MGIFRKNSPDLEGDTDLLTRPQNKQDERLQEDDGGHDRFAHYVKKEKIIQSAISGKPVRALCGKKWVPGFDPDRYPVCPECKKIYEGLPSGKPPADE